jgi:hypothetical protein
MSSDRLIFEAIKVAQELLRQNLPPTHNLTEIHRSLNKDAPFNRAIERVGAITSRPVLGGLHHQYCRI